MSLKKVTNIALDICKMREILESKDMEEIYKNLFKFRKLETDIKRHITKYTKEADYELDFMVEDIKALSDLALQVVENLQHDFSYSRIHKKFKKYEPLDGKTFNELSIQLGKNMKIDTELRAFYKDMAYLGIVFSLWSNSSEKITFEQSLINTLRSFI